MRPMRPGAHPATPWTAKNSAAHMPMPLSEGNVLSLEAGAMNLHFCYIA
jgi:hypothetical protein